MAASDDEKQTSREQTARRIRRDILAAQLRVALDEARGRPTPPAVIQLAQLTMPQLPSPFDTFRLEEGTLRTDQASRKEMALYLSREILAAQLRVGLDEARGRRTPEAVKRLARIRLPSW